MKINALLFLSFIFLGLVSCGKEDPIDQEEEVIYPSFQATLDWQQGFLDLVEITNVSDSFPESIDITMDGSEILTPDNIMTTSNIAAFLKDDDSDFDSETVLFASQVDGADTVIIAIEVYGALEEKSYVFASENLLEQIFSDDIEIPDGTVIPYLVSQKSEAASLVALAGLFGAISYGTSSFTITDVDEVMEEVSGNFTFDWTLLGDDEDVPMLKVDDGIFTKLQIVN